MDSRTDDQTGEQEAHALLDRFPLLNIADIESRLHTTCIGKTLVYRPVIDSTNTLALALARESAAEGTVVLTDDQPGGRGRQGRHWKALPGQQALLSIIVYPTFPAQFLVMCAALAVREAIALTSDLDPVIKWPNDVLVAGKKICGILIETSSGADDRLCAVVGIGLNVHGSFKEVPELAERATTIAEQGSENVSREGIIVTLLERFDEGYEILQHGGAEGAWRIWKHWRDHLSTLGQWVRIQQGERLIEGMAIGVDGDGALLIRQADGATTQITWGDIEMR
jgi:BirA family biotin operon repressor/biotin-[acetyl-CoA-carboxylase] ligase